MPQEQRTFAGAHFKTSTRWVEVRAANGELIFYAGCMTSRATEEEIAALYNMDMLALLPTSDEGERDRRILEAYRQSRRLPQGNKQE